MSDDLYDIPTIDSLRGAGSGLPEAEIEGPGIVASIGPGYRAARAGEDWGLNQANYEGQALETISDEALKRGYRKVPRYGRPDLEMQDLFGFVQRERGRDANFLKDYASVQDGKTLREWALTKRKADLDKANEELRGGSVVGQFIGGIGAGLLDPTSYIPVGGEVSLVGKSLVRQILTVGAKEAAANVVVAAATEPLVQADATALGVERTAEDVLLDLGLQGVVGFGIGAAVPAIGAGAKKAAPHVKAAVAPIGDLVVPVLRPIKDIYTSTVEGLSPAARQRAEDAGTLGDRQMVEDIAKNTTPDTRTPDEKAAMNSAVRDAEIAEASPFRPDMHGTDKHGERLAEMLDAVTQDKPLPTRPAPIPPPSPRAVARVPNGDVRGEFKARIGRAESPNDWARNPESSAEGRYQFIDSTFVRYYRKIYGGQGLSDGAILKLKGDGQIQERLMDELVNDNINALGRLGIEANVGNLYVMHFAGESGGAKLLTAAPETPVEQVLGAEVVAHNGFLKGMTAAEAVAELHRRVGGPGGHAVPAGPFPDELTVQSQVVPEIRLDAFESDRPGIMGGYLYGEALPDVGIVSLRPQEIGVNAGLMQFKAGGDERGVTERLRGVETWDPASAGLVMVWERADGTRLIADGHQRHGLASRLLAANPDQDIRLNALVFREEDGFTVRDARIFAARKNINEGTGTALDVAKVIRDAGPEFRRLITPGAAQVRDGTALARLGDEAFGLVINELVPPHYAAWVGRLAPDDPEQQLALTKLLYETDPANSTQAEAIVRQGMAAGFTKEEQIDMFGDSGQVSSLFIQRAKVLDKGLTALKSSKKLFMTAAREAETLESVGSTIAQTASEKEAARNAEAIELVARLAHSAGPIKSALDDAARALADGASLAAATRQFTDAVRKIDLAAATGQRAADVSGADRTGADYGGHGIARGIASQADDADAALAAGEPDPALEQAVSLADLEAEGQGNMFGDPVGPEAKAQSDSLEHDLRMQLERDKITAAHLATRKDAEFKRVMKELGHRESSGAYTETRGWQDAKAGKEPDPKEMDFERAESASPTSYGFNPVQPYAEAYLAALTGERREIRARGAEKFLGLREAAGVIERLRGEGGVADVPLSLDLGEAVDPNAAIDPNEAARQRQELDIAAQQPLTGARKTGEAQSEALPEGLFGEDEEIGFRFDERAGSVSIADLLAEADEAVDAAEVLKGCMAPPTPEAAS